MPTEATPVSVLAHTPPTGVEVKASVSATQTEEDEDVIGDGSELTVTIRVCIVGNN
jgi:hypothetical protein